MGAKKEMHIRFWSESQKDSGHYEELDVGGRIILKWILGSSGMDWIHLDRDTDQWKTLVNTVVNLRVP
jgi:hypothetical protein